MQHSASKVLINDNETKDPIMAFVVQTLHRLVVSNPQSLQLTEIQISELKKLFAKYSGVIISWIESNKGTLDLEILENAENLRSLCS